MQDEQDKSTELGKGMIDKPKSALNKLKKVRKAAKFLKFFIKKVVLSILKWLLGLLGPWGVAVIVIIILLLLVLDSVKGYDIFQLANEREPYEEKFDDTVLEVVTDRLEEAPTHIRDTIRETQPPPKYPPISEAWLFEAGELMKLSHAIPTMHHYYRNLKHTNYKPWHKEVDESQQNEFYSLIFDEFDYYFEDESQMPQYEWGVPPIDEYIETTTVTTCTVTDEEGNTTTTTSESFNREDLPKRDIVLTVELVYHKGTVPYSAVHNITENTVSDGDCTSHITVESELYLVNESVPLEVEFLPKQLVLFLAETAPTGKVTDLVKVQDLEFALELGREIDPGFPKVEVDFDGLTKCYKDKRSVSKCLDEFVLGGQMISNISGTWYPSDYLEIYKAAADACGIDWYVLAAVHGVETGFGSNPAATDPTKGSINEKGEFIGAIGHFQFMPATWLGWAARNDFESTALGNLIIADKNILMDPQLIAKYGGYGKDGDGDGKADPWNIVDAAYSAACYIKANGYVKGNEDSIKNAIFKYNHSWDYVNKVYNSALNFEKGGQSPITVSPGDITYPAVGKVTSGYGWRNLGYGDEFHYGIDIGGGGVNKPIVSVADGEVTFVGTVSSWGKLIRVKHNVNGQEFETLYAHLQSQGVRVGDKVAKGQQIGVMGNTGRSTGIHLHLEVHVPRFISQKASSVNPLTVIPTPPGS